MPVVFYPPNMPLYAQFILHRRHLERYWASPVPFMPMVILATLLFIGSIWGLDIVRDHIMPSMINPQLVTIIFSLLPPLIIMGVMLIFPHLSSPVWPYQLAMLHDQENKQIRWNLAVVATAHLYCGSIAQTEWLSQILSLNGEDRERAFSYIKGVRSRLQQIHVLTLSDVILCFAASATVFLVTFLLFPNRNRQYSQIESLLDAVILMLVISLLMLYLLLQRWQHIRRLIELENVFEELLPAKKPVAPGQVEDEVEQWHREQEAQWSQTTTKKPTIDYPPAPWE